MITSGIHGSETYAGSAVIQMFFDEIFKKIERERIGIFVVHSMNPFGFKNHRRTTESGVNLNRNFSVDGELFKISTPESEEMHRRFFERSPVRSLKSKALHSLNYKNGKPYFEEFSLDEFIKSVSPGQFRRKEDLEFGGFELEPQSLSLIQKMKELVPKYQDILALDLHTGLGHTNRLHLLTSGSGKDLNPDLFKKLFDPKADAEFYEYTPSSTEGFYHVHGDLNSMFESFANSNQRICAITLEYGTLGHGLNEQLKGLNSFILDHQGQFYGFENSELESLIKTESFERSYPENDVWRKAVIDSARGLFLNTLARAGVLVNRI